MKKTKKKIPHGAKLGVFKQELLSHPATSPTDLAYQIYDCKNRGVAATIASQNLKKLNVSFTDLLERAGLTDEQDTKDLKRLRVAKKLSGYFKVDDNQAQIKALELTQRLKGRLKYGGENGNGNGNGTIHFSIILNNIKTGGKNGDGDSGTTRKKGNPAFAIREADSGL